MLNNYIVTIKTNTLTITTTAKAKNEMKAIEKSFKKFSHIKGAMICKDIKML